MGRLLWFDMRGQLAAPAETEYFRSSVFGTRVGDLHLSGLDCLLIEMGLRRLETRNPPGMTKSDIKIPIYTERKA